MKAVIVGCGRVGAVVAEQLDGAGHEVLVIDVRTSAFARLADTFGGSAIRADGTDEEALRRAGAENADLFLALTEGDNRNVMAAQLAAEVLGARRVVAKVNDPVRADAYAELGLATLCRTNLMEDAVNAFLGRPRLHDPGVIAPRGVHPGGDHHIQDGDAARPAATGSPTAAHDAAPVARREV